MISTFSAKIHSVLGTELSYYLITFIKSRLGFFFIRLMSDPFLQVIFEAG
jgi:hypothetical protein